MKAHLPYLFLLKWEPKGCTKLAINVKPPLFTSIGRRFLACKRRKFGGRLQRNMMLDLCSCQATDGVNIWFAEIGFQIAPTDDAAFENHPDTLPLKFLGVLPYTQQSPIVTVNFSAL
jgi:hypothetical protein